MYFNNTTATYKSSLLGTVPHGFGTKQTGDGRDSELIKRLLKREEVNYKTIIVPFQTHSKKVAVITSSVGDLIYRPQNTDGVVTDQKGAVLTVVTADCVPIIYYDSKAEIIGISHGGWKGTLNNIPAKVVRDMERVGGKRHNIRAVIGPSINDCCYEIYGDRLKMFQERFGQTVLSRKENRMYVSLLKSNFLLLREAGLSQRHIDYKLSCTFCNSREFYSYHRDRKINGEMFSFITLL